MARIYASASPDVSEREIRNQARSRRIAAEGMVLLENNGLLPLTLKGRRIALYGNGARRTVKGGTGSGDVNSRSVVTVEQGLEKAGAIITTQTWLNRLDDTVAAARKAYVATMKARIAAGVDNPILELFAHPFTEPQTVAVTEEDMESSGTDTAIYVVARNSGEGADRKAAPGDYLLSDLEKASLTALCGYYRHVVVVLNVGGVIDTHFLRHLPGIDAILLMSQAGNIGGLALADVISGKVNPCGHLTTTWARRYTDYPGAETFSYLNGDVDDEYYREGIYVGYRWFDTFGVRPAYPFGYGLSYTDFAYETQMVRASARRVTVQVKVTNNGSSFAGKAVVQVYVSA